MPFNNPIPRTGLPQFHESSGLRVPRDSDAIPRLWAKNQPATQQLFRTTQAVEQLQRQLNRLRKRGSGGSETSGMVHRGEWVSATQYAEQNVVTRGNLGEFVVFATPPVGTPPETGAPYWHGWSTEPSGRWA
jgi:hypothetical protein